MVFLEIYCHRLMHFCQTDFNALSPNTVFSEWSTVLSGVPQGSVLGPILFILYVDDIGSICSANVSHKLFADDLKLYSTINSDLDRMSLQAALTRLQQWCNDW